MTAGGDLPPANAAGWVAFGLWCCAVLVFIFAAAFGGHWGFYVAALAMLGTGLVLAQFATLPRPIQRIMNWWPFY